ncbi:putative ribonucleoside-diphosphate reductase large chain [Earliella scabrosa]|nr:putative ribonucleoside-diphosphate reductase large chain [Earliella scabrosa]
MDAVTESIRTQVTTSDLQIHTARIIDKLSTKHPDYSLLAGRVYTSNLHKRIDKTFTDWIMRWGTGPSAWLDETVVNTANRHGPDLNAEIVHARDFAFTYRSIKTLSHSYLHQYQGEVIERPQFMYMRLAIAIHPDDVQRIIDTYHALSRHLYSHATPTMFNAGTMTPYLASSFTYQPDADTYETILATTNDLDYLWFANGGVSLSLDQVPCSRGLSDAQPGIMPLAHIYDGHARYISRCRQRRPAAGTVYLSIWHADVLSLVASRTSVAQPRDRWTNLFPALWVPDIFMERLECNGNWALFDPVDVPDLLRSYGAAFKRSYEHYERDVEPRIVLTARELWATIAKAQMKTGAPFILFQDNVNNKNNEQHLGIVRASSVCGETVQFSAPDLTATSIFASLVLPNFVTGNTFDFDALHAITKMVVRNLDRLVDITEILDIDLSSSVSATRTRALGIGVQGLADTFMSLHYPYGSAESRRLNIAIFETIYHASLDASCDLAQEYGHYPAWNGSPASHGILQCDMWTGTTLSGRYDFPTLRERIHKYGLRNSMLTCQMPTACTSQITGYAESTEPYESNITVYQAPSGRFTEICRPLIRELTSRGLWSEELQAAIIREHGSVQAITTIPDDIKAVYLSAWKIDPEVIINMAADRGPFIDQSQSTSLNIMTPSVDDLADVQLLAWRRGLKTGCYYLRVYPLLIPVSTPESSPSTGEDDTHDRSVNDDDNDDIMFFTGV